METWTWAANSVRPYESLWIMTERFLWLNAISAQTLAREIGFPAWPRMDLITVDGGFHNKNMQQARTRLIQLLSLTRAQTRHGTVKASLTVELNKLRVCPECLRMAYHAAIFQLHALSRCPMHDCKLVDMCPHCAAPLPMALDRYSAFFPFACASCRRLLSDSEALVYPPSLGNVSAIQEMWRTIAEMPRVEWTRIPSEQNLLAELTCRMLEERIRKGHKTGPHFHLNPLRNVDPQPSNVGERCYLLTAREQRSVAIYKSYRRHLQKRIRGGRHLAQDLLNRLNSNLKELVWSPAGWERSTEANAFGLFRYAVEWRGFEGIRSVHARRATWVNPATQRRCLPDGDLVPMLKWPREFRFCPSNQRWIEDHVLVVGLRAIFAECLLQGLEMTRSGRTDLRNIQRPTHQCDAAAIAFFNDAGQLEFWSGQFDGMQRQLGPGPIPMQKEGERIKRPGPQGDRSKT